MFHNHAFVHTPICRRATTATWKRNGKISWMKLRKILNSYFCIQNIIQRLSVE
jgi:hypothetical protein